MTQLPFLLHRAAQRADWHVEQRLALLNLTARQFSVLNAILAAPGVSQIGLGTTTGIDRSTVVHIIDRLERRGLVFRAEAPFDRRAVALHLSDEGQDVIAIARPLVDSANEHLLSMLNPGQGTALVQMLSKLIHNGE